jgi:hypothetical protein
MMMAVTSELCLRPANDTFVACSLLLASIWLVISLQQNCSYVNNVPPLDFGQRMAEVTRNVVASFKVDLWMVYYPRLRGTMALTDGLQSIGLAVILMCDLVTYPRNPG